mgnify:FL=1
MQDGDCGEDATGMPSNGTANDRVIGKEFQPRESYAALGGTAGCSLGTMHGEAVLRIRFPAGWPISGRVPGDRCSLTSARGLSFLADHDVLTDRPALIGKLGVDECASKGFGE